jgi:hypothetical protein
MKLILRTLSVVMLAIAMSACGEEDDPPTAPTPPTTFTQTFSGTLTPNGARTHSFATQASGTVTATLSSLAPDATISVGLALGTWNGAVCQILLPNDNAVVTTVVTGGVSAIGSLCVRIADVAATVTQPTDYEIVVVHP